MSESARPASVADGWDCHVHVFEAGAPCLAGHYAPAPAALSTIEALASACGVGHLVLVQPSVYGTDNSVMERALRLGAGRHRGIAVLDGNVDEATLDRLGDAGVCGVRYNLVSPVGNGGEGLLELAPRLRARGWHVQWYAQPSQLAAIAQLQARCGLVFVLDHLAGMHAGAIEPPAQAWSALKQLADAGAWVKLSGWYRLEASEPSYAQIVPNIRRVAKLFGDRMVWGSDWPHTSLAPSAQSRLPSLMQPVRDALGDAALSAILRGNNPYGLRVQG